VNRENETYWSRDWRKKNGTSKQKLGVQGNAGKVGREERNTYFRKSIHTKTRQYDL
jgi:hypothetical protein